MALNWNDVTFNWMQPSAENGDGFAGDASWNIGENPIFSNPEFISLLGEGGLANLYGDQYADSFGFDRDLASRDFDPQKYQQTMNDLGVTFQRANSGDMGSGRYMTFDRLMQGNKQLGRTNMFMNNPLGDIASVAGIALNAVPGLGTTLGNWLGAGTGAAGQALGNALIGGTMSELGGGDFLKGAAGGAVGSLAKTFNLGEALGIADPNLQRAVNSGTAAALNSAIQGGNPLQAGLTAAVPGAVNYGVSELGSMFAPETNMNFYDPMGAGMAPDMSMFDNSTGGGFIGEGVPSGVGNWDSAPGALGEIGPSFLQQVGSFMQGGIPNPFGGKNIGFGDLAGGLLGLYSSYDQRRKARGLQRSLQDLYSPNSPYAQQMRQRLQRQDAAAGRRSQYGNREVQLAAALADSQARMAPTMQSLNTSIDGGNLNMARSMLNLGRLFTPQSQPTSAVAPQNLSSMLQPYNWSNFGSPTVSYPDWLKTLGNSSLGG